jgi:hypothetical protein
LVLEEILDVFDLRQVEKGIQLSFGIEEDIQGLDLFTAGRGKIGGVALENMRQVDPQPIDFAAAERIHVVFGYQGAFPLLDPGQLDLLVAVQVWIKMREHIFLHDDGLVTRHRDSELKYFHHVVLANG